MKISLIMPSFLHEYNDCAKNREEKFIRAVESFIDQTHFEKELVIVSDGCDITNRLVEEKFNGCKQILLIKIKKQPMFSGIVRHIGMQHATGDTFAYLDTDDFIGKLHLSSIETELNNSGCDWIYFDDRLYYGKNEIATREVALQTGLCGTSNIAHKKNLKNVFWKGCDGYGHDWAFLERLIRASTNHRRSFGMSYYVCHRYGFKHDA